MRKPLYALRDDRRNGANTRAARKDAEIAALKEEVSRLYIRNDRLERENRKLGIRNREIEAAYQSLKEVLYERGMVVS